MNEKYKVRVEHLKNENGWDYTKMDVYLVDASQNETFIISINRNIYFEFYLIIEDYKGTDWMLISENYHGGIGVVDLKTGIKYTYDPERDENDEPHTQYWCIGYSPSFDREKEQISIIGCYWACPYTVRTFDFSNPTSVPYPLVTEVDEEDSD